MQRDESATGNVARALSSLPTLWNDEGRRIPIALDGLGADALSKEQELRLIGSVIHAEGVDGSAHLVGRVVRDDQGLAALLPPHIAASCAEGCQLLLARPVENLNDALALLLAPEGADGELEIAQTELMPRLRQGLIARMEERLNATLADLTRQLPQEHPEALAAIAQDLRTELAAPTEELIGDLADRSWQTLGFWGVSSGVARVTGARVSSAWQSGKERALGAIGLGKDEAVKVEAGQETAGEEESTVAETPERGEFLSPEARAELRVALESEVDEFWQRRGDEVLARAGAIIEAHASTSLAGIQSSWLEALRTRVLAASWQESREDVLDALSTYATGMAERRLLSGNSRAPSLTLAYAIRSAAGITDRPLLVLQKAGAAAQPGSLPLVSFISERSSIRRLELSPLARAPR